MIANFDILRSLFEKANHLCPYHETSFTFGEKYVAAISKEGNIGVCATLNARVNPNDTLSINFSNQANRVIINAYVNSVLNYRNHLDGAGDIFDTVDFSTYSIVVMIGYFGSLVEKLKGKGVFPSVFDIDQNEVPVLPMAEQAKYLSKADCIILSSTSIGNSTFGGIVDATPSNCSIFMLGPSTPLDDLMFNIPKVKGVFGSTFPPNHTETLNLIAQGYGTRGFMHNMQKVYRINKNA